MKTTLYLILLTFATLAFVPNSFAQNTSPEYVVRVIYFYPNDVTPQPDIDAKLDELLKDMQQVYAGLMEAHGFGRKTFLLEQDTAGDTLVHQIQGRFNDPYYENDAGKVWPEIRETLDINEHDIIKDIYLVFLDISSGLLNGFACGFGFYEQKRAIIPASGGCFEGDLGVDVTAHELGHAFGLAHDHRPDVDANRIYLNTNDSMITSYCAAEWLDAHPAFNTGSTTLNRNTEIKILEPELESPPNNIRFRFNVSDPDGLHQAKLLIPKSDGDLLLRDCQRLDGAVDSTVEVVGKRLSPDTPSATLRVIDIFGNDTQRTFTFSDPLPFAPPEVVSIADPHLAAAIRSQIGQSITTHTILNLTKLDADNKKIKDLTGLEHAHNLKDLLLRDNTISDASPIAELTQLTFLGLDGNTISDVSSLSRLTELRILGLRDNTILDISPLTELKQLTFLNLNRNTISDVSSLAGLTQLRDLWASGNQISDIMPLTALIRLERLYLRNNQISDASPLIGLVNLKTLHLLGNPIKNRKPLFELLEKNPKVKIYLKDGGEPLPVTLSHFRAEHTEAGVVLKWITESEVDNAGFYIYRSQTRDGEFKVINPTLIQGAGTTSERNGYTWTDTTAKPNVAYYYRIEDISHAGVRKQLATVRMRGLVSASGKLTTRWADLKTQE